jgi:hypothetical protein
VGASLATLPVSPAKIAILVLPVSLIGSLKMGPAVYAMAPVRPVLTHISVLPVGRISISSMTVVCSLVCLGITG